MAAGTASVIIGSHGSWPSTNVTIEGTNYAITASLTGLYPTHATAALSCADQLKAHMDTELGGTNTVTLRKNGKFRITTDFIGGATIAWPQTGGKNLVQDMLGFTQGTLNSIASADADDVSPYIFRPGRTDTPLDALLGSDGRPIHDVRGGVSRDGTTSTRRLGKQTVQTLRFPLIAKARYWDAADEARHFIGWWENVAVNGRNFFHYRNVEEDDASTDAISLGTGKGPYRVDLKRTGGDLPFVRHRSHGPTEAYYDLDLGMFKAPEYT